MDNDGVHLLGAKQKSTSSKSPYLTLVSKCSYKKYQTLVIIMQFTPGSNLIFGCLNGQSGDNFTVAIIQLYSLSFSLFRLIVYFEVYLVSHLTYRYALQQFHRQSYQTIGANDSLIEILRQLATRALRYFSKRYRQWTHLWQYVCFAPEYLLFVSSFLVDTIFLEVN